VINKFYSGDYLRDLAERMKAELEGKAKNNNAEFKLFRCTSDSADVGLGFTVKERKS